MKLCLSCRNKFTSPHWQCPACLISPQLIDDYPVFSPDLAQSNSGFKANFFADLAVIEESNFWFRARNALIIWVLTQYFQSAKNLFEIGCGTGFVLSGISKALPQLELFGSEILSTGLSHARQRLEKVTLLQMDARHIPFENEFDVIGAFDVIEHIEEDEQVLSEMFQAIRPGGGIIVTVPQHKFLWSMQDEYACHVRRYDAHELKNKVVKAGFKIIKTTSFVSFLLPMMFMSRLSKRRHVENYDPVDELQLPALINVIFEKILTVERKIIEMGISFPFGGSLLLVAEKP